MAVITDRLITQMQLYGAAQFTNELLDVVNTVVALSRVMGGFRGLIGPAFNALFSSTKTWVGLGSILMFQIYEIGKAALATEIEFSDLRASLDAVFGTAKKGEQAFQWAQGFAMRTPFELQGVIKALNLMVAEGIQPTEERMKIAGATSKVFFKDISQGVRAIGQAARGNFGSLTRSFGISRNMLPRDLFDGRGHPKDFEKTLEAIFRLLDQKLPHAMDKLNKTVGVQIQNLSDRWKILLSDLTFGAAGEAASASFYAFLGDVLTITDKIIIAFQQVELVIALAFWKFTAFMDKLHKPIFDTHAADHIKTLEEMGKNMAEAQRQRSGYLKTGIPSPEHMGMGETAGKVAAAAIREIIGGGMIAKIGIRPSELPGMVAMRKKSTLRVELSTTEGGNFRTALEEIIQQTVNAMNMHGSAPAGAGASF